MTTTSKPNVKSKLSAADIEQAETRLVNYHHSLAANPKTLRVNRWRPDPDIDQDTQIFEGVLGAGGFGTVYYNPLAYTPPITPSEATIHSPSQIATRNLFAKRYRENRTYLRYIKSGHPNICALEAFLDFTSEVGDPGDQGLVMFASYYEYCDGGDLAGVIDRYTAGHRRRDALMEANVKLDLRNQGKQWRGEPPDELEKIPKGRHPPELFIWHIYSQLIGAVAFLHNEHPDYKDKVEHKDRAMVITADLAPANVFLKWPPGKDRRRCYPDVKVGDFGGANFLPAGGGLELGEEKTDFVWGDPPEDDIYDGKTDVWCVGVMMYMLGARGKMCEFLEAGVDEDGNKKGESVEKKREREQRQKKNKDRVGHLEGLYSLFLDKAVRFALTLDRDKRPTSGKMCKHVEISYLQRQPLMFRALPAWIQLGGNVLKHKFPPDRVSDLLKGKWEEEHELAEKEAEIEEEMQDREDALMWITKDRKLRFGIELDEEEEGDDEIHAQWLEELIKEKPDFYKELLEEARANLPSS
ncbi:hypothetical protein SBOR_4395 [Sclerotinia borealis F-4128]|uniref:non-specific serine/threonine protein kinase n=1 Tax=Sclerotinia borealis (strain F-4128) TaxID=1432307 RepID=W9CH65_SCLBF|nr:hypothetical protein SBOR_4395 [Sclerotinia borealis F-4128]